MGITIEGYCDDCDVYHNCTECDRMSGFIQDYINEYHKRLLEQIESKKNIMTPEQIKFHDDYDRSRYLRIRRYY